jgi:hypothetical protein
LGLGLGDPWVTQASPKGDPSVTHGSRKGRFWVRPLFSTKAGKRPGGEMNREIGRHHATSHIIGKTKTLTNTDNLQGQAGRWRQDRSPMAAIDCQAEQPRVTAG